MKHIFENMGAILLGLLVSTAASLLAFSLLGNVNLSEQEAANEAAVRGYIKVGDVAQAPQQSLGFSAIRFHADAQSFKPTRDVLDIVNWNDTSTLPPTSTELVVVANGESLKEGEDVFNSFLYNAGQNNVRVVGGGNNETAAFGFERFVFGEYTVAFLAINEVDEWQQNAGSFNSGTSYFSEQFVFESVQNAAVQADFVVTFVNWDIPNESSELSWSQAYWSNRLQEWGSDVVVGMNTNARWNRSGNVVYSMGTVDSIEFAVEEDRFVIR